MLQLYVIKFVFLIQKMNIKFFVKIYMVKILM